MYRACAIALLLLTAGCNAREEAAPAKNEAAAGEVAAPAAVKTPSLKGSWKVTSIGGVPDAAALGMTAAFTDETITLSTGCIRRAWTYTQKRNVVAFTASPGGSSNCGGGSPAAGAESAYAAVSDANMVVFSNEGKQASLSGTGGTLTMERR